MADVRRDSEIKALHDEIDRLPAKYRAAIVLCHLEGRTHADAARVLQCPTGTVSIRVAHARELLRDRLVRRGLVFSTTVACANLSHDAASGAIPRGLAEATAALAVRATAGKTFAAGVVPAEVARLTYEVLRTMNLTKLTITAAAVLTTGAIASGVGLVALAQKSGPSEVRAASSAPAAGAEDKEQIARRQSVRNLRMISLAMHQAISANGVGRFPAAAINNEGKPLLSWRVALLPYLGEKGLYDRFHRDEPWDSPHNKTLLEQRPNVYAPVLRRGEPTGATYYQVVVGRGALFADDQGTLFDDVTDLRSQTLMVVEGAQSVPWSAPVDLVFDSDVEQPLPKLGGQFQDGIHVAFADGGVVFLSKPIQPSLLRSLITRNAADTIDPPFCGRSRRHRRTEPKTAGHVE